MIWDFSVIQQKHALTCLGLYKLIFQTFYHTSLILPKREIDETVHFRNFCKPRFYGILAPHFQTGKMKAMKNIRSHAACNSTVAKMCELHRLAKS